MNITQTTQHLKDGRRWVDLQIRTKNTGPENSETGTTGHLHRRHGGQARHDSLDQLYVRKRLDSVGNLSVPHKKGMPMHIVDALADKYKDVALGAILDIRTNAYSDNHVKNFSIVSKMSGIPERELALLIIGCAHGEAIADNQWAGRMDMEPSLN